MKRIVWAVYLVAALVPALCGASDWFVDSARTPAPPFETERWVAAWVELWNTHDLEGVEELFVTDDRLTYLSSEKEGLIVGIEAVREHHRGFGFVRGGTETDSRLWVGNLHTTDLGTSVVVTGLWFFQATDGEIQRGPMTLVYVAEGGGWLLTHLHFADYASEQPTEAR